MLPVGRGCHALPQTSAPYYLLKGLWRLTEAAVLERLPALKHLEYLGLGMCPWATPEAQAAMQEACPRLKVIDLESFGPPSGRTSLGSSPLSASPF